MDWKIAQAKRHFSTLVKSAEHEPQKIYNRDRLVAALISPSELEELNLYRQRSRPAKTLADGAAWVREVVKETGEELELPNRKSRRENAFLEILDEVPD